MILDGTLDLIYKYFQTVLFKTMTPDEFQKQGKNFLSLNKNERVADYFFMTNILLFTATTWLGYFERLLKQHNNGKEWFTSTFSFADLAVFHVTDVCVHYLGGDILKHVPLLKSHHERVSARPNIAAFLKSDRRSKVAPRA